MTTLELVYFVIDENGIPCEKGIQFAKENSNIEEALNIILKSDLDKKLYLYLWWIVSQAKIGGWNKMNKVWMKYFGKPNFKEKVSEECAEILRNWIEENKNES